MKQATFLFILLLLIAYLPNTQKLFAQSTDQGVQKLAQKIIERVKNSDEISGLLSDIQSVLQPHSDFLSNTLPNMETDPELKPYIEKYEALKSQYMGDGQSIPINPDVKIFLTASPFALASRYDRSFDNSGICFHEASLIVIDRGFWEYYQDNDEIRESVLFHELGHCDLNQEHGYNAIMSMLWEDDLLNSQTIHWEALYEDFFIMRKKTKSMVCFEENFHLYEECDPSKKQGLTCYEQGNNITCYIWKEFLIRGMSKIPSHLECLLFNPDGFVCSTLL